MELKHLLIVATLLLVANASGSINSKEEAQIHYILQEEGINLDDYRQIIATNRYDSFYISQLINRHNEDFKNRLKRYASDVSYSDGEQSSKERDTIFNMGL